MHTEIAHIWPGERTLQGTQNAGRKLLDGVNDLSGTVSSYSAAPTKTLTNWITDRVNPDYWTPNHRIMATGCYSCRRRFAAKGKEFHHCRACGQGFCDACSDYRRPCADRGWGADAQRTCKKCFDEYNRGGGSSSGGAAGSSSSDVNSEVQARKVTEKVAETFSSLASSVFDYPMNVLKDSARPDYWVPDDDIEHCFVCARPFDSKSLSVHHCRQCGQGVCDSCSKTRRPCPLRGWDNPVRVCDTCITTTKNGEQAAAASE